jgi:hypothetical protein
MGCQPWLGVTHKKMVVVMRPPGLQDNLPQAPPVNTKIKVKSAQTLNMKFSLQNPIHAQKQ